MGDGTRGGATRPGGATAGSATAPPPAPAPVLATAPAPGALPVRLSSFVGRRDDLVAVRGLLGTSRLVTLVGAGGCGKTRLAIEIGRDRRSSGRDAVCWVDLAALSDPELLPATVASALDIREPPGADLTAVIAARLAARSLLLVLDNCEHLVSACGALAETLLRGCPELVVLATSRQRLGIEGETAFRVPSLSVPPPGHDADAARFDAVRLFVERAVQAGVVVAADGTVAEVCRRLDGIPLAIELAAARAPVLTPHQILEGLNDQLGLLTGGGGASGQRHRTLRASVEWSFQLLPAPEQTVLAHLSVFAGEFSFEAAEAVTGRERQPVLDALAGLVDRSLLHVRTTPAGARYRLLEPIRQHATARLADAAEVARDRHLAHYLALAERAEPQLEGPDQVAWVERLEAELPNLRAAGDWARESRQVEQELRLVAALTFFHVYRSHVSVWQGRLQRWMELAEEEPAELRARVLHAAAWFSVFEGDLESGARFGHEMLTVGEQLADPRLVGRARWFIGTVGMWIDPAGSAAAFETGIEALTRAGDHMFGAVSRAFLGWSRFLTGDTERGRTLIDESLRTSRRRGSPWNLMSGLTVHATLHCMVGEYGRAEAAAREAIALSRSVGDAYWCSIHLATLGWILTSCGRTAEASEAVDESVRMAREGNNGIGLAYALCCAGMLGVVRGDGVAAGEALDEALELSDERGMRVLTVMSSALAGAAALLRGELEVAAARWECGVELSRELSFALGEAWNLRGQATLARLTGRGASTVSLARDALGLAAPAGLAPEVVDTLEILASGIISTGGDGLADATRWLAAADAARSRSGAVRPPAQQLLFEADRQAAREALGSVTFDGAWAEGAARSLAETVAHATRGRGRRGRPTFGWESLTDVERDVVRLVAQGLTNPQIAARLFISPRTVQSHLRRIFPRLGITTRAELAAEAGRHEL